MRSVRALTVAIGFVAFGCALAHPKGGAPVDAASDAVDETVLDATMDAVAPDVSDAMPSDGIDVTQADQGMPTDVGDVAEAAVDAYDAGPIDSGYRYQLDPTNTTWTAPQGTDTTLTHHTVVCTDTDVVTGVLSNANDYVNAFGLRCATLAPDGTLGADTMVALVGGTSGTNYDDQCTAGSVVVDGNGHAGAVLDQSAFHCQSWDAFFSATPPTFVLGPRGGTGGTAFTDPCPSRSLVHGFDYDIESYGGHNRVTNFRMQCIPITR